MGIAPGRIRRGRVAGGEGRPRPDYGSLVPITIEIEPVQVKQLDRQAKQLGVSRQALLRAILRKWYGDRDVQFAP